MTHTRLPGVLDLPGVDQVPRPDAEAGAAEDELLPTLVG